MSDGQVISFGSRKPFLNEALEAKVEAEAQAVRDQIMEDVVVEAQVSGLAQTIRGMADLVESGAISGVLAIGRDTHKRKFLTELSIDPRRMSAGEVYEWIGIVETLKLELMDIAQMAPVLLSNGTTLDPADNVTVGMDLEDIFDD
jgi:hypothetical protein